MAMSKIDPVAKGFVGRWRIVHMPDFDQAAKDVDVPAYIEFLENGRGSFQFVVVCGEIRAKFSEKKGRPHASFEWLGSDEGDEVRGTGVAFVNGKERMGGYCFMDDGDDYAFVAERDTAVKSKKAPRR